MVRVEDIQLIFDKVFKSMGVDGKCQPDYITSLPYARARTVEEVDKRIEAIDNLISEEETNLENLSQRIQELDDERSDIYKENKELEKQIEETQGIIDDFKEYDERERERNEEDRRTLYDDLEFSYVPNDWADEITDNLNGLYNTDEYCDEAKKDNLLNLVARIDDYADNIRPTVVDYMTEQDEEVADNLTSISSDIESLVNPSFQWNSKKEDSDKAELDLGELIESRTINEVREEEINIQENSLLRDYDKGEIKIDKLTQERIKQEKKKDKIKNNSN